MKEDLEAVAKSQGLSSQERGLGSSLCSRCVRSLVYRRTNHMTVTVYCTVAGKAVPSDISECNSFEGTKNLDLYEMQQIALTIDKRVGVNGKSYI